ncbi:MAG: cold shock domain-containing protein [Cytophagaceae bacterium]
MAKSRETYSKKEKEKQKIKKRQDKAEKREARKSDGSKDNSLESMLAYVDENGNITSVPQDLQKRKEVDLESITLGAARRDETEEDEFHTGIVTFYNEQKGFGFVKDDASGESIFIHSTAIIDPIKGREKITYKVENSPRGLVALEVKIVPNKK